MTKQIYLVGNANTGKTTLLNSLTGSDEHTGNWHGVTVEEKEKFYQYNKEKVSVVDLPGIYSLTSFSFEEEVTINKIISSQDEIIINTCDINTINKNLFLTLDLMLLNKKNILIAINSMGVKKPKINIKNIEEKLAVKVVVLDFANKKEVQKLKEAIHNFKSKKNDLTYDKIFYGDVLETIKELKNKNSKNYLEIINFFEKNIFLNKNNKKINKNHQNNLIFLTKQKYEFIDSIIKIDSKKIYGNQIIDKIMLNKIFAIPIFFAIMAGIFYITFFAVGPFFSDLLYDFFQVKIGRFVCNWIESFCEVPWIVDLIENGLFAGVGSLVSFLPQVVLLFLFLALMEDVGYFSRVAFIFEDLFSSIGLSGKSVYTLLMGFGCSASAVLTSRALDNKTAKIKTAILTPYMSCSAKIPVFAVLGGAFFGAGNLLVIFLLYLLGVLTALLVAIFLDKFFLKTKNTAFLIEFPPYRFPKFKKICKITWANMKLFLIKVATIFISVNIIVWILSNFSFQFMYVCDNNGKSMLQTLGEFFAPIFTPLGFNNWGAVGALIAGIIAKEIIVSSLAIFNGIKFDSANDTSSLQHSLTNQNSVVNFTSGTALSYLSFCLLYCPCLATIAVMKKEIGLKWTLFACGLQFIVAYILAFIVYNIFKLINYFNVFNLFLIFLAFILIIFSIFVTKKYVFKKNKCKTCGKCEFCHK